MNCNNSTKDKNYRYDVNKYCAGVCRLCKDVYPDISINLKELNMYPPVICLRNGKKIVKEFTQLTKDVSKKSPDLYLLEIQETNERFFSISDKPSEIIRNLSHAHEDYNTKIMELIQNFVNILPKAVQNMKDVTPNVQKKDLISNSDQIERANKLDKELRTYYEWQKEKIEKIKNHINIIKNKPKQDVNLNLHKVLKTDAYNIKFVKFLNRLRHIYEKNNRNFTYISKRSGNIIEEFYSLDDNHTFRKKLIESLNFTFFKKYPLLSQFLIIYLRELNEMRNLVGHDIPKIEKFSKNCNYAFIPNPEGEDLKINIEKTSNFLRTYDFFISSLEI